MKTVIVMGRFPSLNEWVEACKVQRGKWNAGNAMKQKDQKKICMYLAERMKKGTKLRPRIFIEYTFFELNTRRDKDNISSYFHKIFQDALVQMGYIEDDGWKYIKGMADYFEVDSKNPRVEIVIQEGT